jgi:tetratricopeptide (TPR) repeat protein
MGGVLMRDVCVRRSGMRLVQVTSLGILMLSLTLASHGQEERLTRGTEFQKLRADHELDLARAETPEEIIVATAALARLLTHFAGDDPESSNYLVEAAVLYDSILDQVSVPQSSQICNDYGVVLLRLGQPEQATPVFARVAEIMSSSAPDDEAIVYFYNYGKAEELAGRPREALKLYRKTIGLNASFAPAREAAFQLIQKELTPVEAADEIRDLTEIFFEQGALEIAGDHIQLALQEEQHARLEQYQGSMMLILVNYLASAKIEIENYSERWAPFLNALKWKWSEQAAAYRDWLHTVYLQDLEVPLLELATLDLFRSDTRIAGDLLKVVGDSYSSRDELMWARQRYELAWRTAGHPEAALYLAQLVHYRAEVVDPDGQLRALFLAMSDQVTSNSTDWKTVRNLHVVLGNIATAEGDLEHSSREFELALEIHDNESYDTSSYDTSYDTEPVPRLHERLAQWHEVEGRRQSAIEHYLKASKGYYALGHFQAGDASHAQATLLENSQEDAESLETPQASPTFHSARESLGGKNRRSKRAEKKAAKVEAKSYAPGSEWVSPTHLQAQSDDSYKDFIDGVGEMLYFLAWPSAAYESVSFGGVSAAYGGADVKVMLHGKSFFSEEPLWTEVVVQFRDGKVRDVKWGRNNARLAQPGSTVTALGEALVELNAEYERSQGNSGFQGGSSGSSYGYHFTNSCGHPLRLAIRYTVGNDHWETKGWWEFKPGKASYLVSEGKKILANNAVWYFYAETTDGSHLAWTGEATTASLNGKKFKMKRLEDKHGDSNWTVTCN